MVPARGLRSGHQRPRYPRSCTVGWRWWRSCCRLTRIRHLTWRNSLRQKWNLTRQAACYLLRFYRIVSI
jgi:hypothetical protein